MNIKYIILAAGQGIDAFSNSKKIPKCLLKIDNKTIIDHNLNICKSLNISDINLVGGFEILKIMEKYPSLQYFYNEKWQETNTLYSLSKTIEVMNSDLVISYSDIIHDQMTIKKLINNNSQISAAYDSKWMNRFENRDTNDLEKVFYNKEQMFFSKDNDGYEILGEFAGLLYIPKIKLHKLKQLILDILEKKVDATVLDLLNTLVLNEEINLLDIEGNWAEADSIQDIEHFKFGTKAETLSLLKGKVQASNILEQYTFIVDDYQKNSNKVIETLKNNINSQYLVVRSSALNEDTHNSSMAGNYESILKVPSSNDFSIKESIETVINSYTKNNQKQDNKNQILVQPYLENVSMSGVVFTKNLQTGSPYYIINYDNSDDTTTVTSGSGSDLNTFICYRKYNTPIYDTKLNSLIEAIKEIEKLTSYDAIDVEFAFANNKLYILQVRPIAAHKDSIVVVEDDINNEINSLREFINLSPYNQVSLKGTQSAYGVMPDWNPAEIIGLNPKPLSFDLYRYLITDQIWAKSRKSLGYRDVADSAGLVSFVGKPYVDIRMSFNTFIPSELNHDISEKLVDYFLDKLKKEPQNHDKVEFNIAITSYDFNFDDKEKELLRYGFNEKEIVAIRNAYKSLTEEIILEKNTSINQELSRATILEEKRNKVVNSKLNLIDKIYLLLEDCKNFGTLPFANLARFGFIGSIFLKSLLHKKLIDENEYDGFFKSINTVAKDFLEDFGLLIKKTITKEEFLDKYGHLRPGTYDITSKSYKENFDGYLDTNIKLESHADNIDFQFSTQLKDTINKELKKSNLSFSADELINFIKSATEAREKSKFEFSKNLSLVLELISQLGEDLGFSKDELAYINLNDILQYKNSSSRINIYEEIKESILSNKKKHLLTSAIQLPELIFGEDDIDMFFYSNLKPNFITHHSLESEIILLSENLDINIDNKIVLIENADPGFDWIFSHNIRGLITKYGGAASHMAIRCSEFDLPAAIGCGEKIFNNLLLYKKVHLDCTNHKIKGIF